MSSKLVTFELAKDFKGASLEGLIHVNPEHVTAVHFLDKLKATAIFISNFQVMVNESESSVVNRLGFEVEPLTQDQEGEN